MRGVQLGSRDMTLLHLTNLTPCFLSLLGVRGPWDMDRSLSTYRHRVPWDSHGILPSSQFEIDTKPDRHETTIEPRQLHQRNHDPEKQYL